MYMCTYMLRWSRVCEEDELADADIASDTHDAACGTRRERQPGGGLQAPQQRAPGAVAADHRGAAGDQLAAAGSELDGDAGAAC